MQRSEGFTITEVSLFLAVSALLAIVVMIGVGSTLQASRFTDSSRSLHAYIQKQYDNLLNGVNPRTGQEACAAGVVNTGSNQTPGTSNCLLLGRLLTLKSDAATVEAYNIVGVEPATPDYNATDEKLIRQYSPVVVRNSGVDVYQIPWQATISGSKRLTTESPAPAVDALAMIRSPRSNRIVYYTFKEPGPVYNLYSLIDPDIAANANNISKPANYCLQSADAFSSGSRIHVTGGQGQDAIQLEFATTAGDCDGV